MKILQVTMQFGRSYVQGTERYVATLSDGLRERGHDVLVLTGDPLHLGPPLALGEPLAGEKQVLAYPTRGWMAVTGLSPRKLDHWLRRHRPDIVHVNTPAHIGVGIMPACRQLSIPCVVTTHDYWWVCPKGTLLRPGGEVCDGTPGWATCVRCLAGDHTRGWVRRLARVPLASSPLLLAMYFARAAGRRMSPVDMIRWTRRRPFLAGQLDAAGFVIFPSKAISQVIAPYLGHQRWRIIPNGLTKVWLENPRPPPDSVKEPADLTIGFAGTLAPYKGPHVLLEAVRLLGWKQTRVRLAGPITCEHYAGRLHALGDGLNVEFAGRLPVEKMPAFLRSLDVLAMTSIWPENCPYAVLEAQAAGVPVVGSRDGGVVELIEDRRMLFDPGSPEGLAAALEYARRHPAAGRRARVTTAEEMTDAVVSIYQEALDSKRDIIYGR